MCGNSFLPPRLSVKGLTWGFGFDVLSKGSSYVNSEYSLHTKKEFKG